MEHSRDKLRILLFCAADLRIAGGSQIRGRLLTEGLSRAGADVAVVSSGVPEALTRQGLQSWTFSQGLSPPDVLLNSAMVFRPDVIYGVTEGLADLVVETARKVDCLAAVDIHGIGFVEALELGRGYGSRRLRVKNSARWLTRLRAADLVTVANPTLVPVAKLAYRRVLPLIGTADVKHFAQDGPAVTLGKSSASVQVLYAGNHYRWQGLPLLIQAIARLTKRDDRFEFTILGSAGDDQQFVERMTSSLPGGIVHFIRATTYESIPSYYRAADILVIPRPFLLSTYLAFPQKICDYMAAGRMIVATDIAPHRWALKDPACGVLCAPTARGIAKGILEATEPHLQDQYSQNARAKASNTFSHLRQGERLYEVLSQLVAGDETAQPWGRKYGFVSSPS